MIRPISHLSKVMLQPILGRLVNHEDISWKRNKHVSDYLGEPLYKFSTWSVGWKIFATLFHNLIAFKKAFDRVWHDGLWLVLRECNMDNWLIQVIKSLYDEATSTVVLNGSVKDFFRTTQNQRIRMVAGQYPRLTLEFSLSTAKRRKLSWLLSMYAATVRSKLILQGTVHGSRRRGRLRKLWRANIKEWTDQSLSSFLHRSPLATITAKASIRILQRRLGVKELVNSFVS